MSCHTAFAGFTVPITCTSTTAEKSLISILAKAFVAQDARIGDEHVDPPERVERLFDEMGDARIVGDRGAVGDGFTTHRFDSRQRPSAPASEEPPVPSTAPPRSLTTTFAPRRANSSACARRGPARTGDDRHLAVESNGHGKSPSGTNGAGE